MKKFRLKRMLSLVLAISLLLSTMNGITIPVTAAEASSGTDENGFSWTSDGTSVTITGYNPATDSSLFYGIEYNGHYYGLSVATKTWTDAKADCEANGGHLVTIADEAEQKIVQDLFSYDTSTTAWIGATDEVTEGEWTWCTGEEFTYANWNSGEPNDGNDGVDGNKENYAGIYIDNFKWNDFPDTQNIKYICEWEELPPEDVFSLYRFYGLEYNGHYYGLSQNKLTWEAAKQSCESVGGQLVSINDEDEQALVSRLLGFAPSGNRWIGAYKADGLWQWVDGEVLGYTNWDPGEPNGNADTAHIYYSNHRWDDAGGTMYYICEWAEQPSEQYFKVCLSDIVIPETINDLPVTAIGSSAFVNKTTISSVVIPDTVTSIGASAFAGCSSIKIFTVSDKLATIGDYAFNGCSSLTEFDIPNSVTSIGAYAFNGCSTISEILIPDSVTTIGRNAFAGTKITEITIPASITQMHTHDYYEDRRWSALVGATDLRKVIFEDRTDIPSYALQGCNQITEVVIPDSVTTIGRRAFVDCSSIEEIKLPDNIQTLQWAAFHRCTNLKEINLPDSLVTIEDSVFDGCTQLTGVVLPNGLTSLGAYAFNGCSTISEILIPDSVTTIGRNAFAGTKITEITIPASITQMHTHDYYEDRRWSALVGATDLRKVIFEDRTDIPSYALQGCNQITEVVIPDGVTTIGRWAFRGCSSVESVDLPDNIQTIQYAAFHQCTGLKEVKLPKNLVTIEESAFNGCTNLTNTNIPDQVTVIGPYAFKDCLNITQFEIPDSVTTIGSYALQGTSITEITIPASVTQMDTYNYYEDRRYSALVGATELRKVIFEDRTDIPSYALQGCNQITEVVIPDGVTTIGRWAFRNCTSLTSMDIPQTVKNINDYAFNGCNSIESITIEENSEIKVVEYNNHYYAVFDTFKKWDEAKQICEAFGGHLVTVTDADEQTFITELVNKSGKVCWLGASDNEEEGVWKWVTGEEFTYNNWRYNQPDNANGVEHYLANWLSDYDYKWNDFPIDSGASGFICEWDNTDGMANITPVVMTANDEFVNSLKSVGNYVFDGCSSLTNVYYSGTEEIWNTVTVGTNNEPLNNATFHFGHTHTFGEWAIDYEPTCAKEGKKHKTCLECGYATYEAIDKVAHTYELEIVPPTYLEQGYTLYTCSVCGDTYKDTYVDPLDRIDLSSATLELEYTSVFYEGLALTPNVTLKYEGETFDSSKELKITYVDNNQVGTATVTVEGINRFEGTVELQFEITYEVIPEQIVNVVAIGEIGKVSLSWGESSEVNTDSYNIYRKADGETEYTLIKTINGRTVLSYEDKNVEKSKTYSYYVTGVGLYGAESEPSMVVTATVLVDEVAPTVLKVSPAAASVVSGQTTLSATVTDNIGVTKVAYYYTLDNGENWIAIGETTNKAFSIVFDTSDLGSVAVKVKAIAYDAEGNESEPNTVVYSLDNTGPEKVTGLSAVTLSSKITLSWNDVTANDAAYFILQTKSGEEWTTVAKKVTTLGYTITNLQPDTDYIYRVACVDTHGNVGEYSDEFTARTAKDETAPVITGQSPNSARYNSTINFSATAKDDCDIKTIEIQVSSDLSSWTTVSTNTYTARTYKQTYTYTIDLSGYAEGSIFVRAVATDFSGNISDTSDTAPYTEYIVDKTAPAAPLNITANGNDGYITVSWSMGNESDLGKYFVYKSTSLDGNYQLVASNLSSLNYHDRNVQSGREFYYKVKVSDSCGNMSEYSNAASATMSPDTQAPEITGISSTYQQKISEKTHTINVTANDNNKLSYIVVEYATSTNSEYTQLVVEENIDNHYKSIAVTLPIDILADGDTIYLRAYAVDMAGQRSEYATSTYTVDATPPMIENYTALLDVSTVYLDWTDCGETDLSGFKVYRSLDGENFTLLGSRGVSNSGSYSFIDTITDKESNTYIYKLESIDRLGNTASWLKSVEYTYVYVNQIPIAQMSIPSYMTVGVEEIFDASGSTDDIVIMSYLWDFGDGTTSTEMQPIKSYDAVGTYTVKLSVTDNEGITSTITKEIEVKERDLLGTLNVKVVDENNKALSYVPVYFDLGSDNQKIIYTNASGVATLQMLSGSHTIGMYASGYLPVKKDVVVLANATRTVTLTTVAEDIVTGNFEITRMEFEDIIAAGIDIYDPANQNVYSATVRVTYGSTPPLTINYVRNDDKILTYTINDTNGNPVTHYTNSNGESRKITGVTYIPSSTGGKDVVAIMDIPAEASYLTDFFNVRLHIVNNASSEFTLEMNEVVLNVPEGMTLMTSVSGDYSSSNTVKIDAIKGQETVTLSWMLRGDKAGEYDLSADFTGTLAEFNELVTARFETEEPIKVYGLEGVKFRILVADEIHNDTLYFNIELENERDVDIHMPSIGLTDKIKNVTESVLHNNADDDFLSEAYILNAYIQNENGQKQYVPITYDANGKATTGIKTLPHGQKIVYEYVAYNAINYDGVAYFKEAAITEFEGVIDNIETGSFHKELYSFVNYSEKLQAILSGTDPDVSAAFEFINNKDNYYYVEEAEDIYTSVCYYLYGLTDLVLSGDISIFTQEEERALIEQLLISMLTDSSSVAAVDELIAQKYLQSVKTIISETKLNLINRYEDYSDYWGSSGSTGEIVDGDDPKFPLDEFPPMEGKDPTKYFDEVFTDIADDEISLAITYMRDGEEEFMNVLQQKLAGYGIGVALNQLNVNNKGAFKEQLSKGTLLATEVLDALSATEQDAYLYSVLKLECNAEYCNYVLDAIIQNTTDPRILLVANDLKQTLNTTMSEFEYKIISFCENFAYETTKYVAQDIIKDFMDTALSVSPAVLLKAVKIVMEVFNMDSYYKQHGDFDVYNSVSKALAQSFEDVAPQANDLQSQGYAMCILKALCELRLSGETEFKSFMNDYMDGKYAIPLSEETILKEINKVMNTDYTTIDEWWDDVQYNILHSRDILFNVESISQLETPRAPVVTLDYDKLQTVQTFTSDYEYCFADGVWQQCKNEPISFNVGVTPSTIRVRKAASDTNFVGDTTTVKIFAKKDLSKLITAKFDGVNYLLDNLSANRNYQVLFTNDLEVEVDWTKAQTISGSDSTVKISGVEEYSHIIIRSCQSAELQETTSNPLNLTVAKKKLLNLVIDGSGTVKQTADSGCYFNGESIDLNATANAGCSFIGWYIDGVCVSTDKHYIVEMTDDLEVVAQFTGVKIKSISIEELPTKLNYYEGESINLDGLKVLVTYSDGSTSYAEQFAAQLSSNVAGKSVVVITYGGYSTSYDITISHNESDWITTTTATMFNEGLQVKKCTCCGKIVETKVVPMLVDDSGIIVDPNEYLIYNIPEYLFTSDAIITHYNELGCRIKILDSSSSATDCVMTGGYVMYAGTKYSAVIFGDTTGDGEIDIFDILGMLDHVNGDIELEGVYERAGLVVNEEEIDIFDTLAVLDHVNGDASINP